MSILKKIVIPVTYEVYGEIVLDGEFQSYEEALNYFNEHKDEIPLPKKTEYVDDSFRSSCEVEDLHLYQHNK